MYQNIQVNHTNIKEYLKIAEERMLTDDVTEEDIKWYIKLSEMDILYSSDIGQQVIEKEKEYSKQQLEEKQKVEKCYKKMTGILNILNDYEERLSAIIKQNNDNK